MQKKKNNADDAETPPLATTPLNSSTEIPGAEVGAEAAVVATEKNDAPDSGHTMLGSAFVVGIMTLISRLTGLWRFRVMGEVFGASGVADAFNFAFIFPNLTRKLFGEGLLTSLFVPVFAGKMAQGEKEAANRTASILLVKLSYWLSLGCVLCVGVSMALRFALASALNLSPERILEFKLFEALLPYCVFINVAAVLMAILNSLDHFWMPAFAPVLLNVAVILACYFGLPLFGTLAHEQIWAVALAVLIGGAIQFLVQLPPAFALGFKFSFSTDSTDSGYREVMDNFKPVALMVAVFQLNVLVDNLIAQKFIPGDGPVTYMNMGTSVYQMAWALIALAIGVAALPTLSRQWAQNKTREFHQTLTTALRYAVFASIPCTIGALLLSEDIVRFLYGTGKFLAHDGEPVRRTSGVVFFSCLGLVFYSVNAILVRALYAMKDMKTPTRTLFHSVLLNLALNLFFVLAGPKIASALYETVKGFALTPQTSGEAITPMATTLRLFGLDVFNFIGSFGHLKESGIILSGTISTAWQTWALAKAVRARTGGAAAVAVNSDFSLILFGTAALSSLLGLGVYRFFATKDGETLFAFLYGALAFLGPILFVGQDYLAKRFNAIRAKLNVSKDTPLPESEYPEALKFQQALFTSFAAAAVMGLLVWAVRDSMPPEGRTRAQVLQRAIAPVLAGIVVYSIASSALLSREYDELWSLLKRKFSRTK